MAKLADLVLKTKDNDFQILAGSASFLYPAYMVGKYYVPNSVSNSFRSDLVYHIFSEIKTTVGIWTTILFCENGYWEICATLDLSPGAISQNMDHAVNLAETTKPNHILPVASPSNILICVSSDNKVMRVKKIRKETYSGLYLSHPCVDVHQCVFDGSHSSC